MQVCTLFQTDNHASTPPLSFLQAGCRSCRPANSVKAPKAFHRRKQTVNELTDAARHAVGGRPDADVAAAPELIGGRQEVVGGPRQRQAARAHQPTDGRQRLLGAAAARRAHDEAASGRLQTRTQVHCTRTDLPGHQPCGRLASRVVIAKFHYTNTDTGPTRTRTRTDPHGPNGVSPQKKSVNVSVSGPCRARVVEFCY